MKEGREIMEVETEGLKREKEEEKWLWLYIWCDGVVFVLLFVL